MRRAGPVLIPGDRFIFVIGDAARALDDKGHALPALASSTSIQQGRYVARLLGDRTAPASRAPFVYKDRGILATIGKGARGGANRPVSHRRPPSLVALVGRLHFLLDRIFETGYGSCSNGSGTTPRSVPAPRLIIAKNGENRVERRARG